MPTPNGDCGSDRFSTRIKFHPKLKWFQPEETDPLVLAMSDHLLVDPDVYDDVVLWLGQNGVRLLSETTVFDGLPFEPGPGPGDTRILRLDFPGSLNAITATQGIREAFPGIDGRVSPNHVLVPAPAGHNCPCGPPSPVADPPEILPAPAPTQPVTVIDAGYQWHKDWPANPLNQLCPSLNPIDAEVLPNTWQTGDPQVWQLGTPDVPDANGDGVLDALAGHANFVAGVIAQGCRDADITIRNHNGGYADAGDLPTEAAVVRSLFLSKGAKVINLGFAFPPLGGFSSTAWDAAMLHLANGADPPIVVAPAGNQGLNQQYFPAALSTVYNNIVAVASIDQPPLGGPPVLSRFSNYGAWVSGSAIGRDVVSTFLHVDMALEDEKGEDAPGLDPTARDFAQNNWASWSGTSFAAPKIAAAIVRDLVAEPVPLDAWAGLSQRGELDPAREKGVAFR